MIEVGLSGGIGSGKTSASRVFQNLGVPIYDADSRAKILMNTNKSVISKITTLLGAGAYSDNKLQTQYIAQLIFANSHLKKNTEDIVHPAVHEDYITWRSNQTAPIVIHENALMFANESYKKFHATIFMYCPQDLRISRIITRDSMSKEQALQRIQAQTDDKTCLKKATYTITNDNTVLMIPQIIHIYSILNTTTHG